MIATPDPDTLHPIPGSPGVVFLKPLLARHPQVANVAAGDFSCYHDHDAGAALRFLELCVRYNHGEGRLSIGRWCAIAHRATFLMPGANHAMAGPSTYPFGILGGAFADALPLADYPWRGGGDIAIGHDVWPGTECLVLPGVTIGHGAVVGARGGRDGRAAPFRRRRQSRARGADALRRCDRRAAALHRLVGLAGGARAARHPRAGEGRRRGAHSRLSTPSTSRSAQGVLRNSARSASSE